MENHKGKMKSQLSDSLRQLMTHRPFEKITIKEICDKTGVIRATFYNYFDDKYDCLNNIVYEDLVESVLPSIQSQKFLQNIHQDMMVIEANKEFYQIAFQIIGQNSFEDMIKKNLAILIGQYLIDYRDPQHLSQYSNDTLARYYSECICFCIKEYLFQKKNSLSLADSEKMIVDFMANSITDYSK